MQVRKSLLKAISSVAQPRIVSASLGLAMSWFLDFQKGDLNISDTKGFILQAT